MSWKKSLKTLALISDSRSWRHAEQVSVAAWTQFNTLISSSLRKITTCTCYFIFLAGISAGLVALAAFQLGKNDVAVYDGSWTEFAQRCSHKQILRKKWRKDTSTQWAQTHSALFFAEHSLEKSWLKLTIISVCFSLLAVVGQSTLIILYLFTVHDKS